VPLLGAVDILFNGKLHGFHNKVRAIGNTDSKVKWKQMGCKFVAECAGNVCAYETANCSGDSKREEFGMVVGVFVETEQVYVGEKAFD